MGILSIVLGLGLIAGLALLFGFIANKALPNKSPNWRAAIAGVVVAILLTLPAYIALLGDGAPLVSIAAIMVGTLIMAAICFPIALSITRRQAGPVDPKAFD